MRIQNPDEMERDFTIATRHDELPAVAGYANPAAVRL
jgi:hypothetical protein